MLCSLPVCMIRYINHFVFEPSSLCFDSLSQHLCIQNVPICTCESYQTKRDYQCCLHSISLLTSKSLEEGMVHVHCEHVQCIICPYVPQYIPCHVCTLRAHTVYYMSIRPSVHTLSCMHIASTYSVLYVHTSLSTYPVMYAHCEHIQCIICPYVPQYIPCHVCTLRAHTVYYMSIRPSVHTLSCMHIVSTYCVSYVNRFHNKQTLSYCFSFLL